MSRAALIRFLGFLVPAIIAGIVLYATRDFWLFALAAFLGLFLAIPAERAYRRLSTTDEIKRDLEDRVRNPPS